MARNIFSAQLILYTEAAPNETFEVPAGFVAVMRDCSLFTAVGAAAGYVTVQNSATGPTVVVARLETVGALAYDQWQGRVVVPAGGFLSFVNGSFGTGGEFYAGGYLLQDS